MELRVQPVERRAYVVLFAVPVVVFALTQPHAAKVEAQNGKPKGGEGFHRVVDNLVVHGAAAQRMGMADQH